MSNKLFSVSLSLEEKVNKFKEMASMFEKELPEETEFEIEISKLEKFFSFNSKDIQDWIPRQIRDALRESGIFLRKEKGSTAAKVKLNVEKTDIKPRISY